MMEGAVKKDDGVKEEGKGKGDPIMGMMLCNDKCWPRAGDVTSCKA